MKKIINNNLKYLVFFNVINEFILIFFSSFLGAYFSLKFNLQPPNIFEQPLIYFILVVGIIITLSFKYHLNFLCKNINLEVKNEK